MGKGRRSRGRRKLNIRWETRRDVWEGRKEENRQTGNRRHLKGTTEVQMRGVAGELTDGGVNTSETRRRRSYATATGEFSRRNV